MMTMTMIPHRPLALDEARWSGLVLVSTAGIDNMKPIG